MRPYYEADGKQCECGCGATVRRRFVSGHNRRGERTTAERKAKIGAAQRLAWATKRSRRPVGAAMVDRDGYRRVKVRRGAGRWLPEHRLIVEEALGRPLSKNEVVHHINGDRADNRPDNLYVCRDRSHHNEVHRSQDEVFRDLLARGVVAFRNGVYEAVL